MNTPKRLLATFIQCFDTYTPHYAETLKRWRENFLRRWDRLRALGLSEKFRHLWQFYFCDREGDFREQFLGDMQMLPVRAETTA